MWKSSFNAKQAGEQISSTNTTWGPTFGHEATVTYAYRATPGGLADPLLPTFTRFSSAQIDTAEKALSLWSDMANINFVRVGAGNTGDGAYSNDATILLGRYANVYDAPAHAKGGIGPNLTNPALVNGDVWLNTANGGYSENFETLLHEIGHAIGLSHPGPYNGLDDDATRPAGNQGPLSYEADAKYAQDTQQYSIMSYWSETHSGANYTNSSGLSVAPRTPLIHDIAAIQRIYGANLTTETGNTIYGFNSNAKQSAYHIRTLADGSPEPVVFAIWDAGGNDTLDVSGYGDPQLINLAPGSFSDAGGLVKNISLAEAVDAQGNIRGSANFNAATIVNYMENAIGGSGTDHIYGNAIANRLEGRDGDDFVYAHAGQDRLYGGNGDDRLYGGDGNDELLGGNGNDHLDGENGADLLSGGAGDDTYYVDAGDTVIEHLFVPSGTGLLMAGGTDTVVTSLTSYRLGANVENLSFSYRDPFSSAPSFRGMGNDLGNVISGGGGNDVLQGYGGKDWLVGNSGADRMIGGDDDDTYVVDNVGDAVVETLGSLTRQDTSFGSAYVYEGGTDTVISLLASYKLGDYVENLKFAGTGSFTGRGNEWDNVITGGTANDKLYGEGGNDKLVGGLGADHMVGGAGNDTYIVDDVSDQVVEIEIVPGSRGSRGGIIEAPTTVRDTGGVDEVVTTLSQYTLGLNVENLTLVGDGATGIGNDLNNVIRGGAGQDRIEGKGGNDKLIGGDRYDTFVFSGAVAEIGNDTIEGGDGLTDTYNDVVDFSGFMGRVSVDLSVGSYSATDTSSAVAEGTLRGIEQVIGSDGDDTLVGNAADENKLVGGAGADTISGGAGKDFLTGGADKDLFVFGDGWGLDHILDFTRGEDVLDMRAVTGLTSFSQLLPIEYIPFGDGVLATVSFGGNKIYLAGVDALTAADFWFSGQPDPRDAVIGEESADYYIGDAQANVFQGRGGDDMVFGLGGADRLDGGAGSDTASYFYSPAGVTVDLTAGTGQGGEAEGDTLVNFENLIGSAFADRLIGTIVSNSLSGGDGDDFLSTLAGDDFLSGGAGADTMLGGDGRDLFYADNLDNIDGGEGYDTIHAMETAGYRFLAAGRGIEYVHGNVGDDVLDATGHAAAITLAGATGNDTLTGGLGDDRLDAGAGNDSLDGGAGSDYMTGGDGDDELRGGVGADVVDGGAGIDTASYAGSAAGVAIDLGRGTASGGDAEGDTLRGIENLVGSAFGDALTGGAERGALFGDDGDDVISAAASGSVLDGGAGNDILRAADGDYTLIGGTGDDTLEAAGQGHVEFTGGAGADAFTYRTASGGPLSYQVSDFEIGVDRILLSGQPQGGSPAFADLSIADGAAGAVISWSGGSEMTLLGIAAAEITEADFLVS